MRAWPASARHGRVGLRPLRLRDAATWSEVRTRNREWLEPWEGAPEAQQRLPWDERHTPAVFAVLLAPAAPRGPGRSRSFPFAITCDDRLVGQVEPSATSCAARSTAAASATGSTAGTPAAASCPPPSRWPSTTSSSTPGCTGSRRTSGRRTPRRCAVVRKLGFREEARHERYLYIDGAWRDHLGFALVRDDVPEGLLRRWTAADA